MSVFTSQTCPVVFRQGIERADLLPPWLINQKLYLALDVNFRVLLGGLDLLGGDGDGAVAAAVSYHVLNATKESRVAVEVNISPFLLVPFCI